MKPYLLHLRLPFQLLLSPIFMWALVLAGQRPGGTAALAYVSLHLFGYAGGTALNSWYDRDQGPIGGLATPPVVPPHLLSFSLVWQGVGFVLALAVNAAFASIYASMFLLSLAYSHPRLRWKGRPLLALMTVSLGQGVLAFLAGWAAARGDILSAFTSVGVLGIATATLLVTGLYPLTESYQLEEDAARGDMTFARFLGVRGSFRFASACFLLGGVTAAAVIALRFSVVELLLVLVLIAGLLLWLRRWGTRFERQTVLENYRTTMRVYAATSLPFLAWTAYRLFAT